MSLTTSVKNRLLDAINVAFDAVGFDIHTKMPRTSKGDNKAPVAWEYFVSNHLMTRARARFEAARKQAVQAGVIFDHEKFPREPGTIETVFTGEHVSVLLTVNNPATRIDADKLCAYLIEKGVKPKLVEAAYTHATEKSRPAHVFRVALLSENGTGK